MSCTCLQLTAHKAAIKEPVLRQIFVCATLAGMDTSCNTGIIYHMAIKWYSVPISTITMVCNCINNIIMVLDTNECGNANWRL